MAVKITMIGEDKFKVVDLASGKELKNTFWFEKSKNKYHIRIDEANSANRKYVSAKEFEANKTGNDYVVEDKTTGPRVMGTSNPDKKFVPFMEADEKAFVERIWTELAKLHEANKPGKVDPNSEEGLVAAIKRAEAKLAAMKAGKPAQATPAAPAPVAKAKAPAPVAKAPVKKA